jgi:hypothetical protein
MELGVSVALYAFPLGALPFAVRADSSARRIAILSLFIAPLVGVVTYLIVTGRWSWTGVMAVLPFAILPLGFWAALLGALATPVLRQVHERLGDNPAAFVVASATSGACLGAVFMLGFSLVVASVQARSIELSPHVLSGFSAGAFVATLAARRFVSRLPSSRDMQPPMTHAGSP